MVLTEDDKRHVKDIWSHVHSHAEAFGAEALNRMFAAHPSTKVYFLQLDLSSDLANIKAHGKKVMDALTAAVNQLDNVAGALSKLSDLHAEELRVDPVNFDLLRHCILVTIAAHDPEPLKPSVLLSLDKFLCHVNSTMTSKYR